MSVDTSSTVDETAVTLRTPQELLNVAGDNSDWADSSETANSRLMAATLKQAETIVRLREARDLNRERVRRLLARLRQLQANPAQLTEDGEAIDQRMSQLLERAASQAVDAKTQHANTERAQLAAMRELSRRNATLLLNTHFRRNLAQVTASKGVNALLAFLAGVGFLATSRSAWPTDIYPAILCFALAASWGWGYITALIATTRRPALCRKDWRASLGSASPILSDQTTSAASGVHSTASSDKCTVADLLAEWRMTPTTDALRF
jgi:hypothetical protein